MKKKKKYLLIRIEIIHGELEYTYRVLHTTKCENINFAAEMYVARFWGYEGRIGDYWNWAPGNSGRVGKVTELTKKQYKKLFDLFY